MIFSAPEVELELTEKPGKTQEQIRESRIGFLTLLSIVIGFVGGAIAFVLYHLIGFLTNVFYYQRVSFTFVSPAGSTLGPIIILIPVLGGLVAGLLIKYGSPKIIGHGIPETMESVLLNSSVVHPKVGILKALSASFTIGSGQPFGAEGPIIQTGGAFGSFIGQLVDITGSERRILLASGAAAGMAATFGTPISAVLLAVELILFEFRVKSLVPVGIASAIGGLMHLLLISPTPLFATPQFQLPISLGSVSSLLLFAVLGIICGVVGSGMSKALYKSEDMFRRLPIGQPWLPMIGGLGVGLIGFAVPQVLGVGYGTISDILNGRVVVELAILIMVAKAAAWIFAMGSQTSGGTLAPLFMVGSALGFVYGSALSGFVSPLGLVPGIFAVAGLAAVFGTASRAPIASFVFALEVTRDFQIAIPVMVTILCAELVGEYLMEETIMTERLARRDLRVRNRYEYNPLRQIRTSQIMSSPATTVGENEKVMDVYKLMNQPGHDYWKRKRLIVVSSSGRVIGTVDREAILSEVTRIETGAADKEEKIGKITSGAYFTIKETEMAYEALVLMSLKDTTYLIVVDKENRVVGYVSRGDLIRAQKKKILDETIIQKARYFR
jgi:chloride channel protein, CIC family